MNKFLSFCYGAVSVLMYIAGVLIILWAIVGKSYDPITKLMLGVGVFSFGLLLSGFSYIVDAACKYLQDNSEEKE